VKAGEAAAKVEGGYEGGCGEVLEKAVVAKGSEGTRCGVWIGRADWMAAGQLGWLAACLPSDTWKGFTWKSIAAGLWRRLHAPLERAPSRVSSPPLSPVV